MEVRCCSVHSSLSYLGLCSQRSGKCRLSGPLLWDPDAATELPGGALVFESLPRYWGEAWHETPAKGQSEPEDTSWRWLLRVGLWNPGIMPCPWWPSQFLCTPLWVNGLGPSQPRIHHRECWAKMASSISEGQIPPKASQDRAAGREHCHLPTFPKIVIWLHRRGGLKGSEQTEAF